MPIYHFNLTNGTRDEDEDGTELSNATEARTQAVIFAGAHLRDHPELLWDGQRFAVEVTDDSDKRLFTIAVEAHEE